MAQQTDCDYLNQYSGTLSLEKWVMSAGLAKAMTCGR